MHIVLTGSTGFIGSEILRQLLADDAVDRVSCLTRRAPEPRSEKLDVLLHQDFLHYGDQLTDSLSGADACLWALGGKASDSPDPTAYEAVTHGFAMAYAHRITSRPGGPTTFCYLSGMGARRDGDVRLPWQRQTRIIKGRTEYDLGILAAANRRLRVHSFRPGGVLPAHTPAILRRITAPFAVGVDQLATAMIAVATGAPAPDVVTNADIASLAGAPAATRR